MIHPRKLGVMRRPLCVLPRHCGEGKKIVVEYDLKTL
jgi:hypothetical protein